MIYNHAVTDSIKGESTLKQFLPQALGGGGREVKSSCWKLFATSVVMAKEREVSSLPSLFCIRCGTLTRGGDRQVAGGVRFLPWVCWRYVCAPVFPLGIALGRVTGTNAESVSHSPIFSIWIQGCGTNLLPCCLRNLKV